MNSPRSRRHPALLFVCVLAALWLATGSAHASVEVDLNGDGVVDAVDVVHAPDEQIVVRISGAPPQVFHVRSRIINVVATDFNHDGRVDITALSERRGILIWLNGQRGTFKAAKRRVHARALRWS